MISDRTPSTLSGVGGTECDAEEALAHRVERAGADVAVDDADRGQTATGTIDFEGDRYQTHSLQCAYGVS